MNLSIIIPVLAEKNNINEILGFLSSHNTKNDTEIIVVDGSKNGDTISTIINKGVIKLVSERGRGSQMNKGAEGAKGEILLFLHADTRLPKNGLQIIKSAVRDGYSAGAFSLGIASNNIWLKFVSLTANLRTFFTKIPYGDQAIFIKRDLFHSLGGYSEIPIMEDIDLMKRVKRAKWRMVILKEKAYTSARRWEKEGLIITTLKNHLLRILYSLGVSPFKLARFYR